MKPPPFSSLQVFPKKLVAFSTWIDRTRWARNTWAMAAIIIVTTADIVDMVSPRGGAAQDPTLPFPYSPHPIIVHGPVKPIVKPIKAELQRGGGFSQRGHPLVGMSSSLPQNPASLGWLRSPFLGWGDITTLRPPSSPCSSFPQLSCWQDSGGLGNGTAAVPPRRPGGCGEQPKYYSYIALLALVATIMLVQVSHMVKLTLMVLITGAAGTVNIYAWGHIFDHYDRRRGQQSA